MDKKNKDIDETYMGLKYPDYKNWRDLDAAIARGGYWPSGEVVRLSDPEMKPRMDELLDKIKTDPDFARNLIIGLGIVDDRDIE